MDEYSGHWLVGNPDRGDVIPDPSGRLIVGGTYHIHGPQQIVLAELETRDREGNSAKIRRAGRSHKRGFSELGIDFADGTQEVFAMRDDGRLDRISSTSPTVELGLTLAPATDFDESTQPDPGAIPPILFNTMPKSGSIYISRALSQGLRIPETKIGVCLFPNDLVIREKLDAFSAGYIIAQQHLPASDINVRFIGSRLERLVVHVRDPRQATLSWLHHLDNFHAQRDTVPACRLGLEALDPQLPDGYFELPEDRKLDHLIETHYRQVIAWAEGWLNAAGPESPAPTIKFTRYEDFLDDEEAFLADLLSFYEIPADAFDWSKLPDKTEQTHYRKGLRDEWRDVFSKAQQARCAALLPDAIADAFDWDRN